MKVDTALRPSLEPFRLAPPGASLFLSLILVSLAYYLGAMAAFAIGTLTQMFAPFWPPNVVLLCALLTVPQRRWWMYVLAVFPAHVAVELNVAMPVPQLLGAFACNVAVALLNAIALRRFVGGPPWLDDLRKASLYLLFTAVISPGLVAFAAGFEPMLGDGEAGRYWDYWWRWYLSNALGSLTLTPVYLTWAGDGIRRLRLAPRVRWLEAVALALGLAVSCMIAFGVPSESATDHLMPALLYTPIPLLLWAAVRFGAKGASGAILVVTVLLLWQAMVDHGPFAAAAPGQSVLALQLFLAVISTPVLLLAALVEELNRTNERLAGVLDGLRGLTARLLDAQDQERRRIARELHDSTAQNLLGATLGIARAAQLASAMEERAREALDESKALIQQAQTEIRTVSYLLHPPMLDEAGLNMALNWYVRGFTKRSGIAVTLEVSPDLSKTRLPEDVELALFRIVQEGLTNVHRHSGSATARIRMERERTSEAEGHVVLAIEDDGHGLPQDLTDNAAGGQSTLSADRVGVGLAGMQERLRQLGGRLECRSSTYGTTVRAILPIGDSLGG